MEIVSNVALISINETLIVQLVSFLIFLFLITRIMIRPLRKVMGERQDYIQGIQQEIAASKKTIDAYRRRLEDQMQKAKKEARLLTQKMEAEGMEEAERIFESAREEIAALKESAAREIAAQLDQAKSALASESEALAAAIMEKMLDRRLNP